MYQNAGFYYVIGDIFCKNYNFLTNLAEKTSGIEFLVSLSRVWDDKKDQNKKYLFKNYFFENDFFEIIFSVTFFVENFKIL